MYLFYLNLTKDWILKFSLEISENVTQIVTSQQGTMNIQYNKNGGNWKGMNVSAGTAYYYCLGFYAIDPGKEDILDDSWVPPIQHFHAHTHGQTGIHFLDVRWRAWNVTWLGPQWGLSVAEASRRSEFNYLPTRLIFCGTQRGIYIVLTCPSGPQSGSCKAAVCVLVRLM